MNRMAFGPRPGDLDRVRKMRFPAYVDEQLHPDDANDPACELHLKSARLHIQYEAGHDDQNRKYPAVNEDRPLNCIGQSAGELWKLLDPTIPRPSEEHIRPLI